MAQNGRNGNGNGNGSWQHAAAKESAGLVFAEGTSVLFSLGTVAVLAQFFPDAIKRGSQVLGKAVVEPVLDPLEKVMGLLCRLDECQVDKTKSREERAENLARIVLLNVPAILVSLGAKLASRKGLNHLFDVKLKHINSKKKFLGMNEHDWGVFSWDEPVHLGSMILLNTAFAKQSDQMVRTARDVLIKLGVPEKTAKDVASMAVVWELPNMMGLGAGVLKVGHDQHRDYHRTHVEKLAKSTSSLSTLIPSHP